MRQFETFGEKWSSYGVLIFLIYQEFGLRQRATPVSFPRLSGRTSSLADCFVGSGEALCLAFLSVLSFIVCVIEFPEKPHGSAGARLCYRTGSTNRGF
jgi:hypothetical protein